MPPKKKQPANAFYFFMLDRKVHYEQNGERFPNGLKDVADIVGPEWKVLPAAAKKKYEDLAKEEKARQRGDTARKYTNQHNSFDYLDRNRAEEEEARQLMNKTIESTIRAICNTRKIAEFKFYLIHVNYFCITEGECYHPAELAVAEFSLAEGVSNIYHTIINAGHIPLGYRHDAMQKSESVHHIPLEPEDGEKQQYVIWKKVKAILEHGRSAHGGSYPPMYTMPDNVNLNTSISCVKSVVQHLCEGSGDNPDDFQIYSLEKLFFELKNTCAEQSGVEDGVDGQSIYWPSIPFACSKLEEDVYNFTPNIACSFHYNEDHVINCSKSFVQRWAFLICDECCQYLNIQLIPGKHVPKNSDVNFKQHHERREKEKSAEAAASIAPKSFRIIDHSSGKPMTTFIPVELQHPPLPQPKIQPSIPKPVPKPTPVYSAIDNSEENFPAIPVGRGRGRIAPRGGGGGRGSGPMSFAAAMQSRK